MKKGQILEGYIERVDFPNKGFAVVEDEEKKVIVKNTVPEQKVRFAVNKIRKGQAEGRLLEILEHSPNVSRHVRILEPVADALIRICRMKSRWR